jgi:putative transposase
MSRQLRLEYPGSLHHVTSRGNARQDIFLDDQDRELFLEMLSTCVKRFSWILTAYVLMSNHFHLVVQLTEESLSRGMQWLNGCYPQAFNRRYGRVGHLLQGRPDIRLVEGETYGLEVIRYVVLNPVRAKIVSRPENYRWSSHRAVLGDVPVPDWLAVDDVLIQFGSTRELARAAYREFVDAAVGVETNLWRDLVGQIYLGGEDWLQRVRARVDLKPRVDEHPRLQRMVGPPSMTTIIRSVADMFALGEAKIREGRGGMPRMIAAWIAWHEGQLTNAEIAAGLRLRSSGHVTRLVAQCEGELRRHAGVREYVHECLSTLGRDRAEGKV